MSDILWDLKHEAEQSTSPAILDRSIETIEQLHAEVASLQNKHEKEIHKAGKVIDYQRAENADLTQQLASLKQSNVDIAHMLLHNMKEEAELWASNLILDTSLRVIVDVGAMQKQLASLKEQNALLAGQVQQLAAALKPFCDGDVPDDDSPENYVLNAKAALTAYTQQVGSEDARDAERYRWLKSNLYGEAIHIGEAYISMRVIGACPSQTDIDDAIDAAISAQEPK